MPCQARGSAAKRMDSSLFHLLVRLILLIVFCIPGVASLLTKLGADLRTGHPVQKVNESAGGKLRAVRRVEAAAVSELDADWIRAMFLSTSELDVT